MPVYNITLKDHATAEDVEKLKKKISEQGGTVKHEFKLAKGLSVEFPDAAVQILEADSLVLAIEADSEVKTQ